MTGLSLTHQYKQSWQPSDHLLLVDFAVEICSKTQNVLLRVRWLHAMRPQAAYAEEIGRVHCSEIRCALEQALANGTETANRFHGNPVQKSKSTVTHQKQRQVNARCLHAFICRLAALKNMSKNSTLQACTARLQCTVSTDHSQVISLLVAAFRVAILGFCY